MTVQPLARPELPVAVFSPHPLQPSRDRAVSDVELETGETLGAYLERVGISERLGHRPVRVTIGGHNVPRDLWWHCRPKPGTLIHVQVLVQKSGGGGGGGGKNPIASVLSIALFFAAPALGGLILGETLAAQTAFSVFGQSITWGRILGAGISIVGGLALNAIFPPPNPQQSQLAQAQGIMGVAPQHESPTYSLTGGSNRARPYEPMPVIMGTHRFFPDAGAKTYTEFEGDDQYLYQVFDFGYNDVELSDFMIGSTPLDNYEGVETEISGADGALDLFPANVDTTAGAALTIAAGWIVRNSSPNATALAVEVEGQIYEILNDGSIGALQVYIEVEYRAVGASTWLPFWAGSSTIVLSSSRRKPLRRTYKIGVANGQYEVRVRRTSGDVSGTRQVADVAWSQLRTYQPDSADYTGRKRVALKIKASGQLNGTVSQFSAIARARTLVWDGAQWVTDQTSNPAWWVLATARGKTAAGRRVWGGGIPDSRIGIDNIKAFAVWCDEQRLTFNGVFDRQLSVYDMMAAIALRGRGTISRAPGMIEVVWDAPNLPAVAVFGMSNIKLDTFEIEYVSEELADEIVLSFINPDLDWQTDVVRALAPGVTDPVRSRSMELIGCTNAEEAGRDANLYIATNIHRTKKYRWQMDWEGMPVSRGEVGYLSHDLASYDYSGRLIEGTTSATLRLERAVPLNSAGAWVTLVQPDGTFATYAVEGGTGESSTLTLVTPLGFDPGSDPDHPPYDYRWLYGHTATPGRKVKIEGITVKDYDTVELTAIDETAEYYASESNPYIHVPVRSTFGNAPVISNLRITEEGVRAGRGYLVRVIVTWDAGPDFGFADVSTAVDGEPLTLAREGVRARSFEFIVADGADVEVSLTAYGNLGRLGRSTTATISQAIDFAGIARPSDVESFTLDGGSFYWDEVPDVDVAGYRIRFHYGNKRSFDDATPLHQGLLTSAPYTPATLPAGLVTFLIVAEDAAQLWSEAAAAIVQDLGDALVANVVEEIDFAAEGWPGTLTNGTEVGGELVADSSTSFYNENGNAPMYGADTDSFYKADSFAVMEYETAAFTVTEALVGSRMTIDAVVQAETYAIEYRETGPGPLYGADSDSFYGPDDEPFYDAPPGYATWPGAILAGNTEYQILVRTAEGPIQGVISELTVVIDAPDMEEALENIAISPSGTRLPITKPFTVIQNIQLTLEDDGGDAVSARWVDKDVVFGPLVECIDGAQVPVSGLLDARIKGY